MIAIVFSLGLTLYFVLRLDTDVSQLKDDSKESRLGRGCHWFWGLD